ncbi:MAG: molybdopterin molybdotransferase MoeA [Gammaproteobacteria bacterium]|jgi:molybdopterin molybdotransferase|nr:molybdopterin molybdotransferase MoeA [Gammaproteobacteria bacterium]
MKKKNYSCMDDFDPNSIFIEDALKVINKISKKIIDYEHVELKNSYGRVIFENIKSRLKVPNYDNSAMDGYALNIKDTKNNKIFNVIGKSLAGSPSKKKIKKYECIKIMTGAVVPKNCNVIIIKEEVELLKNNKISLISKNIKLKQNIRFAGEDIKPNKIIIKKNVEINSSIMGLLASQGINKIKVYRKPKVSFFTSGDEVVAVNKKLPKGKVHDSNRFTLFGMLKKVNIDVIDLGHAKDNISNIKSKFKKAINKSDIVISTGGVSVGDADYIKDVANSLGDINFWKVAVKPGRPLAFGKLKDTIFFGLPGNPVSVMITFLLFVLPCIKMLSGEHYQLVTKDAVLDSNLKKRQGRAELQRGIAYERNKKIHVKSVGKQGSGILSSMNNANCLIYLSVEQGLCKINSKVKIIKFKDYI